MSSDNRENRRLAARVLKEIDGELAAGRFGYAARFPRSPRRAHFGLRLWRSFRHLESRSEERGHEASLLKLGWRSDAAAGG